MLKKSDELVASDYRDEERFIASYHHWRIMM